MSHADPPWSMQRCMHELMVTVRSNEYWIASTRAPCFSCARFATVLGLLFPAGSAICPGGEGSPRPLPVSDEIRYFQLIYVQQISAPTLADIVQLHADYDLLLGCRYVMNHCGGCGARFSDSKLFESREGLFNPGRARPNRVSALCRADRRDRARVSNSEQHCNLAGRPCRQGGRGGARHDRRRGAPCRQGRGGGSVGRPGWSVACIRALVRPALAKSGGPRRPGRQPRIPQKAVRWPLTSRLRGQAAVSAVMLYADGAPIGCHPRRN